jgi:hypothetical protein
MNHGEILNAPREFMVCGTKAKESTLFAGLNPPRRDSPVNGPAGWRHQFRPFK